jgi:Zn-dependent protease
MFLSLREIFDIVLMCLALGFIFGDVFGRRKSHNSLNDNYDPIKHYSQKRLNLFGINLNLDNIKYAILLTAPAIIFHEFGHKFVAIAFGYHAEFFAARTWLLIAVVLRMMSFPFLFFVPAYVQFSGNPLPWQSSLIAFSGPAVNLLLFLVSYFLLKTKKIPKKYIQFAGLTKNINLFLFIFNMLPIPGFDGFHVFSGIIQTLF